MLILAAFGGFFGYLYWMAVSLSSKPASQMSSVAAMATKQAAERAAVLERPVSGEYLAMPTATPGGLVLAYGAPVDRMPVQSVAHGVRAAVLGRRVWADVASALAVAAPGRVVAVSTATPDPGVWVGDVVYVSYWPDDGPLWCADYDAVAARCVSPVTTGDAWRDVVDVAAACPGEWLGRELELPGVGRYRCLDTGPGARCDTGYCSVYLLRRDYVVGVVPGLLY